MKFEVTKDIMEINIFSVQILQMHTLENYKAVVEKYGVSSWCPLGFDVTSRY